MKSHSIVLIAWLSAIILSNPVAAAGGGTNAEEPFDPAFGLEEWFSQADADWQISFPYDNTTSGGNGSGRIESELNFKHIDSPVTILRGRGRLNQDWMLDAAFGFGSVNGGRGTDTDRDFPSTGGETTFSESHEDISGDVRLVEINLMYREKKPDNQYSHWGAIIGYFHYEDNLEITNGVQTISVPGWWWNPNTNPPLGPFGGLHSTFDFSWDALKLGGLYEAPLAKALSFTGILAIYPYVSYDGEGYWNLRAGTDFRLQSPSFVQKSTSGFGYDATLGFAYRISEQAEFSLGYRYLYLKANSGTDTEYKADGSIGLANLDWAKVTRQGAYVGFSYKF